MKCNLLYLAVSIVVYLIFIQLEDYIYLPYFNYMNTNHYSIIDLNSIVENFVKRLLGALVIVLILLGLHKFPAIQSKVTLSIIVFTLISIYFLGLIFYITLR